MAGVVGTMILAVSNSAQSAQAGSNRAGSNYRGLEVYLPWGLPWGEPQPALLL
jgi:hypothetical protein